MPIPREWLLSSLPWVQYRTRLDLLGETERGKAVKATRQAMLDHPQVQALVKDLRAWPGPTLTRHNDANHLLHKLVFSADLGLRATDPGVEQIVDRVLNHQAAEGVFQVKVNIPTHFGGTGKDQFAWMLCDAPSIVYALVKLGVKDRRVKIAAKQLSGLIRDNGWPCAATPELGKFHGPGRRSDPCPYANLITLKALAQTREWHEDEVCHLGAEALLNLWQQRKAQRPYLFGMGKDFAKLKAPLIWYDILHVTEVLTQFEWLRKDQRLGEMIAIVKAKADGQDRFTPESIWQAWREWDFGQKREPSAWLTLIAQRMLQRIQSE
ncbi:hypothetical protein TFLX_01264 [Thermoflexales bacterium]|nr:hypothetical protein TFLX_01264 [Thermoflexales bacterium]